MARIIKGENLTTTSIQPLDPCACVAVVVGAGRDGVVFDGAKLVVPPWAEDKTREAEVDMLGVRRMNADVAG